MRASSIRLEYERTWKNVVNAIYQLLPRQAEVDLRLREVLHYQEVQQLTSLVNALVGACIPVAGSVVANVICKFVD